MRDECRSNKSHVHRRKEHFRLSRWAMVALVASACGAADKFAAETDDEYTGPLGEVTIGEPGGVVKTFPASGVSLAAAEEAGVDAGGGNMDASTGFDGGTKGSFGSGGSAGSAGSFGKGGSFAGNGGSFVPDGGGGGGFGPSGSGTSTTAHLHRTSSSTLPATGPTRNTR